MPAAVPRLPPHRSLKRILYRSYTYPAGDEPGGWTGWLPLPMAQKFNNKTWSRGFRLIRRSRYALPMIGEAVFAWDEGRFNGREETGYQLPNLKGAEIRIQVANPPLRGQESSFTPAWRTAWWGRVDYQEKNPTQGLITYYAFDGFACARSWRMNRHTAYVGNRLYTRCAGHPGYNVGLEGWYARVIGNRDDAAHKGNQWNDIPDDKNHDIAFIPPGLAANPNQAWTDQQAIESACAIGRGPGDPVFECRQYDATPYGIDLLSGVSSWPVVEGQTVHEFVSRICDRRRGRGLVFVDWEDDSANPTGDLDVCLRVLPAFLADLTFTPPGSTATTIRGANYLGTAAAIDLGDDQRLVSGSLAIADRSQYRYDYVESLGEPIEVLATLSYQDGNLEKRWTTADAATFKTLTARQRSSVRWDPVFQRHGTIAGWKISAKDGNAGTITAEHRLDYRCLDSGLIETPNLTDTDGASPLTIRLLRDLPLYEAYNYGTGVAGGVRYDAATDTFAPPRRTPMVLTRSSSDRYLDLTRLGFQLQIDPEWGFYVRAGQDQDEATAGRLLSESGTPGFGFSYTSLILTVGLQLSNRVRLATGNPLGRRRIPVYHSGIHLWLASKGAIWDLDRQTSAQAEAPAKRAAGKPVIETTAQPCGILRDDRPALAFLHALACTWYLADHAPFSYLLRADVTTGSWKNDNGQAVTFPKLGQVGTTISYRNRAGLIVAEPVNVPITGIDQDDVNETAKYTADWTELDFNA